MKYHILKKKCPRVPLKFSQLHKRLSQEGEDTTSLFLKHSIFIVFFHYYLVHLHLLQLVLYGFDRLLVACPSSAFQIFGFPSTTRNALDIVIQHTHRHEKIPFWVKMVD